MRNPEDYVLTNLTYSSLFHCNTHHDHKTLSLMKQHFFPSYKAPAIAQRHSTNSLGNNSTATDTTSCYKRVPPTICWTLLQRCPYQNVYNSMKI